MNIDKEVNMKLFQQQQEQSRHLDYEKEFGIYKSNRQWQHGGGKSPS